MEENNDLGHQRSIHFIICYDRNTNTRIGSSDRVSVQSIHK